AASLSLRGEALRLPPETLHLLVEVAPLEPQTLGRLGHAPARALERRLDLLPLELAHRVAQPRARRGGSFGAREDRLDLLRADGGAPGHDPEPLHDVPQLADVAGEGVAPEQI